MQEDHWRILHVLSPFLKHCNICNAHWSTVPSDAQPLGVKRAFAFWPLTSSQSFISMEDVQVHPLQLKKDIPLGWVSSTPLKFLINTVCLLGLFDVHSASWNPFAPRIDRSWLGQFGSCGKCCDLVINHHGLTSVFQITTRGRCAWGWGTTVCWRNRLTATRSASPRRSSWRRNSWWSVALSSRTPWCRSSNFSIHRTQYWYLENKFFFFFFFFLECSQSKVVVSFSSDNFAPLTFVLNVWWHPFLSFLLNLRTKMKSAFDDRSEVKHICFFFYRPFSCLDRP